MASWSPRWFGPPFPGGLGTPSTCLQGRAPLSSQLALALALLGLDPGSVASRRVWWAQWRPRSALPPDVPWCLGWKRNRAAGLNGTESSHPALFPGHPLPLPRVEWNSVWVAAEGSSVLRAFAGGLDGGGWRWGGLSWRKTETGWFQDMREAGGRGLGVWVGGVVSEAGP